MTARFPARKHKTPRALAAAVTALAALGLAGCGSGFSGGAAENSPAPDAGGPLNILSSTRST